MTKPEPAPSHRSVLSALLFLVILCLTPLPAAAYVDPTTGRATATRVSRAADIPEKNWLPGHRGVDLAAPAGSDILAAGDGTVAFTGVIAGVPVVSIDHADGIRTTYQPVHCSVATGDTVREGQPIGRLAPADDGHDGLHWGARTGPDTYINPLSLLGSPPIRLKPLGSERGHTTHVDGPGHTRF